VPDPDYRLTEAGHPWALSAYVVGENMKSFVRRIAVVIGAAAISAGLIGATAVPATAENGSISGSISVSSRDSSWPGS